MRASGIRVVACLAGMSLWVLLSSAFAYEPPRGSPVRAAIMDSVRIPVERELGPPVLLTVTALNVEGTWAFASVKAIRPDGKLDWSRTRHARAMASGAMSDSILALLRANGDQWSVVEFALGPTDVPWISWSAKYRIPQKFFQDAYARNGRPPSSDSQAPPPAPPVDAPPVQSGPATADWKTWKFGDLTFRAPSIWQNIDSPPARALRIGGEPWSATFADRNPSGERHAMIVFTWADDELIYSRSLDDKQIVGRGRQVFADIEGKRIFFRIKDRYNDFRGFDVISSKPLKGGIFSFGCRAPQAQWPALADTCEEVLASIAFGPVAAPAEPVAPEKPRDQPQVYATPTPESSVSAKPTENAAPGSDSPAATALRSAELALNQIEAYEKSPRSEDWKLGLAAAQKAVDLDPKSSQFWRLLGRIYAAGGKEMDLSPALAEEAYERAIALDPTHAETRLRLAALLEKREARAAAIEHLEAALSASPSLATLPAVLGLARTYAADDQARRGAAFFARLAERDSPGHAAQLGQALLLKEDNQAEAAVAIATQLAGDPKAPVAVIEQARALVEDLRNTGLGGK